MYLYVGGLMAPTPIYYNMDPARMAWKLTTRRRAVPAKYRMQANIMALLLPLYMIFDPIPAPMTAPRMEKAARTVICS